MSSSERIWMDAWRRAGPALEKLRREELRRVDHRAVIASFDDAFEAALRSVAAPDWSGLVAQQRRFARLRSRQ